MAHHRLLPFLALIISLLILPSSSQAQQTTPALFSEANDYLKAGNSLTWQGQTLALDNNCTLIYYKNGTPIKTFNTSINTSCDLRVNHLGQLVFDTGNPDITAHIGDRGEKGYYALLFIDNENVGVFGPAIWNSTGTSGSYKSMERPEVLKHEQLTETTSNNFIFSSNYVNGSEGNDLPVAINGDFSADITAQCTLAVKNMKTNIIKWESKPPSTETKKCFLSLTNRGQFLLHYKENSVLQTQWTGGSYVFDKPNLFIALLRTNGVLFVFGNHYNITDILPVAPTPAPAPVPVAPTPAPAAFAEKIKMVTA